MPISTGTFSVGTNYRLELSANIVGSDASGFSIQYELGLRLLSGSGGTGSLNLEQGTSWVTSGSGAGGTLTAGYTVSPSAPYAVLWSRIVTARESDMATNGRSLQFSAQSTVGNANALGTTTQLTVVVTMPAASLATWPSFTPMTFNAGSAITVSLPRQVGTYTHDLLYSFGAITDSLLATGIGTTYSYTPPLSLLSQIPAASEGAYTITAITRTATGTEVGRRSFTGTLRAPTSAGPTVSAYAVSDTNASVASLVGAFVEDLSVLRLDSITATATNGATIDDRRLEIEGASLRVADTRALLNPGTIPVTAAAWDSRGLRGTLAGTVPVLAYTGPQNFSRVFRSTAAGVAAEQGAYLSVALPGTVVKSLINGTERNQMTIRISTRPFAGGAWTVRNTVNPSTTTAAGYLSYGGTIVVGGGAIYAPGDSFAVRVEVMDRFNTATVEHTAPTAFVTVDMNGSSVGIGKMHERGTLDVGGAGHFRGLYSVQESITNANLAIYGGTWDMDSLTATNVPVGLSGRLSLDVKRFYLNASTDFLAQTVKTVSGSVVWTRAGNVNTSTSLATFTSWTVDTSSGYVSGSSSERAALPASALFDGLKFQELDTGIEYIRRSGTWAVNYRPMGAYTTTVVGIPSAMVTAEYEQRGNMIHVEIEYIRTGTAGAPTATVSFTLPFTPASSLTRQPGTGLFRLQGGAEYVVQPRYTGGSTINVNFITASGSAMAAGTNLNATYPTASAHGIGTTLHLSMDYKIA